MRLVAATNRDLEREVREGRFRADLYYRLSVFPIALPPLRERREDIPLLVWHFLTRRQAALGRSVKRVPERLMRAFTAHAWPGNVRELENVVERALIMTSGATLAADPAFLEAAPLAAAVGPEASLAEAERAHIRTVLDACGWKISGKGNAADRLGLNRSTLQFRMKKLGIVRPERESVSVASRSRGPTTRARLEDAPAVRAVPRRRRRATSSSLPTEAVEGAIPGRCEACSTSSTSIAAASLSSPRERRACGCSTPRCGPGIPEQPPRGPRVPPALVRRAAAARAAALVLAAAPGRACRRRPRPSWPT